MPSPVATITITELAVQFIDQQNTATLRLIEKEVNTLTNSATATHTIFEGDILDSSATGTPRLTEAIAESFRNTMTGIITFGETISGGDNAYGDGAYGDGVYGDV